MKKGVCMRLNNLLKKIRQELRPRWTIKIHIKGGAAIDIDLVQENTASYEFNCRLDDLSYEEQIAEMIKVSRGFSDTEFTDACAKSYADGFAAAMSRVRCCAGSPPVSIRKDWGPF